ncbi:hypothetical protein BV20DRAFT_981717 [Pilatotrama ljubarskyi]|nr:hypothetical protein BV20DRAFT_981717 [Pilatotrama ljubarskyi]
MQSSDAPSWTPLPTASISAGATDLAVHTQIIPTPSASLCTGARGGRNAPRKRYPQEVYDILTDYYNNVTKNPKRYERESLAMRIKCLPGCADYTQEKVQHYFAGKRQAEKHKAQSQAQTQKPPVQPGSSTSGHILYPSLVNDPSVLPKLDVLLNETPNPSLVVANIWASRLGGGVLMGDIITYAELRRAQERPESATRVVVPSSRSQLPTPESSTSPEPHSTPTSPVVETSWGKVEQVDEVKHELESEYEDDESVEPKFDPGATHIPDARLHVIAEELNKALTMPPSPIGEHARPPKTFEDLSQWFKQQHAATAFLESIGRTNPAARKPPLPVNGQMHT